MGCCFLLRLVPARPCSGSEDREHAARIMADTDTARRVRAPRLRGRASTQRQRSPHPSSRRSRVGVSRCFGLPSRSRPAAGKRPARAPFPGQVGPVLRVETDDDAMCAVRADSHAGPALARDAFDGGPPRTVVFDGFVVCEVVGRAPTRARDDDVHAVLSCGYRGSALSGRVSPQAWPPPCEASTACAGGASPLNPFGGRRERREQVRRHHSS